MTETMITRAPISTPATRQPVPFGRIAGVAGLLAVAAGVAQTVAVGSTPGLDKSAAEVVAYFADNGTAHKAGVVISALLAIPLVLFFTGVYRTLAAADREHDSSWATTFLFGAIMMSATAGLSEGLIAIPVLRGSGLDPATLRAVNDGSLIAFATIGVWLAVAVGSVAVATFQHRIRARWYGWLSAIGALLGVLAVIETVSTSTGGVFGQLAFLVGFIVWIVATSILMLRDNK